MKLFSKKLRTGPSPKQGSFSGLSGDDSVKTDAALDQLQKQLEAEKTGRREERFIWIVMCVILVDVLWFRNATNAVVPIVVLLLEVVVLFILAKRMGVEEVTLLFERFIQSFSERR